MLKGLEVRARSCEGVVSSACWWWRRYVLDYEVERRVRREGRAGTAVQQERAPGGVVPRPGSEYAPC